MGWRPLAARRRSLAIRASSTLVELEAEVVEQPGNFNSWSTARSASNPDEVDPALPVADFVFVGSVGDVDAWLHVPGATAVGLFASADYGAVYHPVDLANADGVLELVMSGRCEGDRPTSGFAAMVTGDPEVVGLSVLGWRFVEFQMGVAVLPDATVVESVALDNADGSNKGQDLLDLSLC